MSQDDVRLCRLIYMPTELLLLIFTLLPAKDLIRCRQVCSRWKLIVDGLMRSDTLWRVYCQKDFKNIYKIARYKCKPGMLWFNVYRSLSLWPKLAVARESSDEFASASNVNDEIRNFRLLRDGEVGVHKRGSIVYYDLETLEQSKRGSISGDYATYAENSHVIAIKSFHLHLYIVKKAIYSSNETTNITFDAVKSFILVDLEIYYVTLDDDIFVVNLTDFSCKFIKRTDDSVMSLGFTDKLHILTFQRNIYTVINNDLVFNCTLGPNSNLWHQLQEYHFLEQLDWRVYFQWMYALNHTIPQGPLRDIVTVRSYGDIFFVGSNWGVLRIYYAPRNTSGEFDLFNAEPVKQYNFMERRDCPVLSMCPILQIDVMEQEDGHTVLVAMPKKVAILNFNHSFKRTASAAMLPYDDVHKVKFLKIDEPSK